MSGLMSNNVERIKGCVLTTLPQAIRTCLWVLKITIPISLCVRIAQHVGIMEYVGMLASAVFPLMGLQKISKMVSPIIKILGLPENTAFLWLVGNIVGLSYGSAIMIGMASEGKINPNEADLVNSHLAINHSILEDTVLFSALGICAWWLLLFRIPLAIIVVWAKRAKWNRRYTKILRPSLLINGK